ncbi:MAG: Pvc16 family protein [Bryobacteraceae bacterium]|jgi:hypothetical protein
MALIDTGTAIGSVSRLLKNVLTNALTSASPSPVVSISRPEPGTSGIVPQGARLNLFLYEVQLDASLRNVSLTPGRQTPLWLVLRYLLTAFDQNGDSDTDGAHDVLGLAMQALLGMNESGVLEQLNGNKPLIDNPESLKVTFDDGTPDLLSRLMQGPDDRYRTSVPFQIRPVLVATSDPPSSMQLVGVNYISDTIIGPAGVRNILLPGLGSSIESVTPPQVQPGDVLTITGAGLDGDQLAVQFGAVQLPVTMQQSGTLRCVVGGAALDPTKLSAGSQPVSVAQTIAVGKTLFSNALSTALIPLVTSVTAVGLQPVSATNPNVYGAIKLTGQFLGGPSDYVELGLLNSTGVAEVIDRPDPSFAAPADQSAQQVLMLSGEAIPPGTYTAVFRVNGAQSKQAFQIVMA